MKNLFNFYLYLDYRRSHKRYVLRVLFSLIIVMSCLFLFIVFNEQLASSLIISNPALLYFVKLPTVHGIVGSVAQEYKNISLYI